MSSRRHTKPPLFRILLIIIMQEDKVSMRMSAHHHPISHTVDVILNFPIY